MNKIKLLLPNPLVLKLMRIKSLVHTKFYENRLNQFEKEKIRMISEMDSKPILLAGFQKSGNTWLRFLIYNYFNIVNNHAEETLSYKELLEIYQPDMISVKGSNDKLKRYESVTKAPQGFPHIISTHSHYKKAYSHFDKIIYISRHPLDVLVSGYHFYIKNRGKIATAEFPFDSIDSYVLYRLHLWMHNYKSYSNSNKIFHITYEQLKENPEDALIQLYGYLGYQEIDQSALLKSITISSFDSIKKMGREKDQMNGVVSKESYTGEFTRKGKVAGYFDELKPETILRAKDILKSKNIDLDI